MVPARPGLSKITQIWGTYALHSVHSVHFSASHRSWLHSPKKHQPSWVTAAVVSPSMHRSSSHEDVSVCPSSVWVWKLQ